METAERYWSGPYWDGVDAAELRAVPLAAVKPSSLPSPVLRRIVSYTLAHLRSQHPHDALPSYHISVLHCTVRLPSLPSLPSPRPLPLTVCRLWPAVLFEGARCCGQERDETVSAGCDYWFGRETGSFIRIARIQETEAIAVEVVPVELEGREDEGGHDERVANKGVKRPP